MIRIVTDGACKGNPGAGGWAALIIYTDNRIDELGGREPRTTNNRMELQAVIEGLRHVPADVPVEVITDSKYVLQGATKWVHRWRQHDWQTVQGTSVENRDLWEALADLAGQRVQWQHVYGHTGDVYNERANTIAQAYAAGRTPPPRSVQLPTATEHTSDTGLLSRIEQARPAPTTYLSLVRGKVERHTTWDACKARTHGVPGARLKKCKSAAEELATVRAWNMPDMVLT
ncbi:MAG: ribonuclease HI [Chloroflexaceae bacterium]|nr:ribonuclease HI [Chloroflexaceae bacterium]NJO07124.1 ribonuclease HI [Chloroflexaceae bacterium]